MATSRRQYAVTNPDLALAMQRDPRVMLANQAMLAGSDTSPAYGLGGLGRILQGAMGGIANRKNQQRYEGQQQEHMDEVRAKIAEVLGGGRGQGPLGLPATSGLPGNTGIVPPSAGGSPVPPVGPPGDGPMPGVPPVPGAGAPVPGGPGMAASANGMVQNFTPPPGVNPLQTTGGPPTPPVPPQAQGAPVPQATPPTPGMPPVPAARPNVMQPGMPQAPTVGQAPSSMRGRLGMALMGGKSPLSFSQGLQDVYAGLEEDARNEAVQRERMFNLDAAKYDRELADFFGARGDERSAQYTRERDAQGYQYDLGRARQQFEQQWALQVQQQGFQSGEADKERAWERFKMGVELTGVMPGTGDLDPDAVFEALIQQESGGRPGIPGQPTQYGTAWGASQMLDGTAEAMANKLGIPWDPALMRAKTPEGLQYQRTLGRAYFDEGLEKYGGDYSKALMYYHGGPDEAKWGPKTRQYVRSVMGRLPGVQLADMKRPDSGLFGVNPGKKGKPLTATYQKSIGNNVSTLDTVLDLSQQYDDSFFGYGTEFGGRVNNWFTENTGIGDENRVEWWKQYDSMNNVVRNELFGAALTANEQALWDRSVLTPGTNPATARKHLDTQVKILRRALERQAKSAATVYDNSQIYEFLGGDDMGERLSSYKPLEQVQAKPGTPTTQSGTTIRRGGNEYVFDGKGWKRKGGQAPAPKKPATNPSTIAGVFGMPPGGAGSMLLQPQRPQQPMQPGNGSMLLLPQFRR